MCTANKEYFYKLAIFVTFYLTYSSESIHPLLVSDNNPKRLQYFREDEKLCGTLKFRIQSRVNKSSNKYEFLTHALTDLFRNISSEHFVELLRILPHRRVEELMEAKSYPNCRLTFCDEDALMGNCFHVQPNTTATNKNNKILFENIFQSNLKSALCTCEPAGSNLWQDIDKVEPLLERNLVGIVFSAYDKQWEKLGNGAWFVSTKDNYTVEELQASFRLLATRFTEVTTYDWKYNAEMRECTEQNVMACVPQVAAEINKELGFLALRVAVGFDGRVEESKSDTKATTPTPIQVFVNATTNANRIFPGSVWGIVSVAGIGISDADELEATLKVIDRLANIRGREKLTFKIGARVEFRVTPGPSQAVFKNLIQLANKSDFLMFTHKPPKDWSFMTIQQLIRMKQREYSDLRQNLREVNPKVKLIFGSGIPSGGTQNGLPTENTIENFREFWNGMIDYAKRTQSPFLIFEATDQPFKCNKADNSTQGQYDNVGPNGANCREGWFYRVNNSLPPVYLEKVAQIVDGEEEVAEDDEGESFWDGIPQFAKILVGAFAAVVVFGVGLTGYFRRQLNRSKDNVISSAYVEQFQKGGDNWIAALDRDYAVALRMPYDKRLELKKNEFHIDKAAVIGSGQSGIVMKGTMNTVPEPVVFKCTTPISSVMDIKNLMSEIKILSFIGKHEFIVCLLGAQTKKIQKGVIVVALEFCELGSLETFLRKISTNKIDSNNVFGRESKSVPNYVTTTVVGHHSRAYVLHDAVIRGELISEKYCSAENDSNLSSFLLWAFQIASAMEFVSAKKVIHADLAARNVLLSSVDHVKIADFGLSRRLYYQQVGVVHDKDTPLPWRWMAPESLMNLVFSVESDIWMYGVLIWEIFSLGEVPYHGTSYDMQFAEELIKGMRLPRAKFSTENIHDVLLECWNLSPLNRPNFTKLKDFFQKTSLS